MDTPQLQKAILIPSTNSGGSFSNRNKLITFEIPMDGNTYDLSQSFVQLVLSSTVSDPDAPDNGVINIGLSNKAPLDVLSVNNVDFIRNSTLISSRAGVVEQILRTNVLHSNLNYFSKNIAQMESQIDSLYQTFSYDSMNKYSPFLDVYNEGIVSSRYVDPHIKIKLSDLLEMGQMKQYNTMDFGTTTMTFELEDLTRFQMTQNVVVDPDVGITVESVVGVAPVSKVLLKQATETARLQVPLPLFVGQAITVVGYGDPLAGGEPVEFEINTVITGINFNSTANPQVYEITCADALPVLDPAVYETTYASTTIIEYEIAPEDLSFSIDLANLGLVMVAPVKPLQELEYNTYEIEEYSFSPQQYFQHVFYLPPNCSNVWVMFNDPNTKNLLSHTQDVASYRFTIDNVQVLNRDCRTNIVNTMSNVLMNDSLHYLLLKNTFINSSTPLNNLVGLNSFPLEADTLEAREGGEPRNTVLILGTPCDITPNLKNFLVNIDCKDNESISNITLFKQITKMIKFK
jgi:hypothetical protein